MSMSLYFHWFALEASLTKVIHGDENIEVACFNENLKIPNDRMKELIIAVEFVHNIRNLLTEYYTPDVRRKEITYSSQLTRALDRFLFERLFVFDDWMAACCHQLPSGSSITKKAPDSHVVVYDINGHLIHILLSDLKLWSMDDARLETEAYGVSSLQKSNKSFVVIGMPMTLEVAEIWIYYGCENKLLKTKIDSVSFRDEKSKIVIFFARLYGYVHTLIREQTQHSKMMSEWPTMLTVNCCDGMHKMLSSHCYYCRKKQSIVKLYDDKSKPYLKPNVELMKKLDPTLSCIGRVRILSYPLKKGCHRPRNLLQIAIMIENLYNIHSKGYVHGDIRIENLLYSYDGKEAYILDCDFANKENSIYPLVYNSDVFGRHMNAKPSQTMIKTHDRYSLHCCVLEL